MLCRSLLWLAVINCCRSRRWNNLERWLLLLYVKAMSHCTCQLIRTLPLMARLLVLLDRTCACIIALVIHLGLTNDWLDRINISRTTRLLLLLKHLKFNSSDLLCHFFVEQHLFLKFLFQWFYSFFKLSFFSNKFFFSFLHAQFLFSQEIHHPWIRIPYWASYWVMRGTHLTWNSHEHHRLLLLEVLWVSSSIRILLMLIVHHLLWEQVILIIERLNIIVIV